MPGAASLAAQRYYAHPRNLFWPLMAELVDLDAAAPYDARIDALNAAGIGLWDTLRHCHRPGSLDGAIVRTSEVPNAIPALLASHPTIRAIALNGRKAEDAFRRHVLRSLPDPPALLPLPSTSPANQSIPLAARREAWLQLRDWLSP